VEEWAEKEGVSLSKATVKLDVEEEYPSKNREFLEWEDTRVSDKEIREILRHPRLGREPKIILEKLLRSGAREITQEMINRLAKTHKINGKYNYTLKVKEYPIYKKVSNLNAQLIRLKLPYRIGGYRACQGDPNVLRKVRFVKKPVKNPKGRVKLTISSEISGHGYKQG